MKKIILLTMVAILILAIPVMAVEGEISSKIGFGEEETFTYADGKLNLDSLLDDEAMSLGFDFKLAAPAIGDAGDITMYFRPYYNFEVNEMLTLGIDGDIEVEDDDNWMFIKPDGEDTRYAIKLYGNLIFDNAIEGLETGSDNDFVISDGVMLDSENSDWAFDLETGNAVLVNAEFMSENILTVAPYANYRMELAPNLDLGVDNTLTFQVLDGEDKELESSFFAELDLELDDATTFAALIRHDFHIDLDDGDNNYDLMAFGATLEYTGIESITLGFTGDLDDELQIKPNSTEFTDEYEGMLFIQRLDLINDDASTVNFIRAKLYADYASEMYVSALDDDIIWGLDNSLSFGGNDDPEVLTVLPYAEYETELNEALTLNARGEIKVVSGPLGDLAAFEDFALEASVTYRF